MKKLTTFFLLMGLFTLVLTVQAGGPFVVNEDGVASTWDNSSAVALHPEGGTCADFTNSQMDDKIEENMAHWSGIAGIELDFALVDGAIPEDVDADNYTDYYVDSSDDAGLEDSLNPVIFDDDAGIVADLFGAANKFVVLGFAGPDGFTSDYSEIVDGQAFFNCRCLDDNPEGACPGGIVFTEDDLDFTMTHEIGHMLGFDHTQVNQAIAEGTDCDLDLDGDCADIPTMYPQSVDAADQITPHRDDEVIALTLYGNSTWENTLCTITGSLTDVNGDSLRCADIQAETGDTTDTIAVVSGAFAPAEDTNGDGYTDGDGECLSNCGDFTLRGLDPDLDYTITVKPIDSSWTGGSSLSPCGTGQLTGIEEEEISTVTTCTAGGTVALGTVQTASTGGITEGDGGDDDDDGDTAESVSIGCALSPNQKVGTNLSCYLMALIPLGLFLVRKGLPGV